MKGVLWESPFHDLSLVVAVHKQADVFVERIQSSGKAPGFTGQSFQIMTQIGVHRFHRIGFFLVGAHLIRRTIVQGIVAMKGIAIILLGLWSSFQAGLEVRTGSFTDRIPTQNAVGRSIHYG